MANSIETLYNLPDIDFIGDISLEDMQEMLITAFSDKYHEITGEAITLAKADPTRIIILAVAQYLYQGLLQIDRAGKMNFLKYAYGDYLRNLAALKGVEELPPQKASVTLLWSLEEARAQDTTIPAMTRVTGDWKVFFETQEAVTIPAGETSVTVMATATEAGEAANGFAPGEISIMVDAVPYIATVVNTTASAGGSDAESDESLAERVFLAPSAYSTAGSKAAYVYHAKSYSTAVQDISVTSPSNGVVDIRVLMTGNVFPTSAQVSALQAYLSADEIRPLTDSVQVSAPDSTSYTITATYYIRASDQTAEATIKAAVESAFADYIAWQGAKIGRDINPDELVARLVRAGAKRVSVTYPTHTSVDDTHVAVCTSSALTYGGIEND